MSDYVAGTKNVWPYYASGNTAASETKSKDGSLGKDEFLKILLAQIKNQDPMQPMEDKEFIAQMAQFTSVEQLTNMSTELKQLRQSMSLSPELIGKSVNWTDKDSAGAEVQKTGIVEAITFKKGVQYALVDGTEVTMDKLTKIWKAGETS